MGLKAIFYRCPRKRIIESLLSLKMSSLEPKRRNCAQLYRMLELWFISIIAVFTIPTWLCRARLREDATLMVWCFIGGVAVIGLSVAWLTWEIRRSGVDRREFGIYIRRQRLSKIALLGMIAVIIRSIFAALR